MAFICGPGSLDKAAYTEREGANSPAAPRCLRRELPEPGARNFPCGANYLAAGRFNFACGAKYLHQALNAKEKEHAINNQPAYWLLKRAVE